MSSSEPRPRTSAASEQTPPALAGIDAEALKSTVPLSSHVLLVGTMLLFFVVATLITLQAGWMWWLIPTVIAVPVAAVLVERTNRMLKSREAARALEEELRAARPTNGPRAGR